jgi:hypothetical protein
VGELTAKLPGEALSSGERRAASRVVGKDHIYSLCSKEVSNDNYEQIGTDEISQLNGRRIRGEQGASLADDRLSAVCEGWHRIQGLLARTRHGNLRLILVRFEVKLIIRHRNQFVAHAEKAANRYNAHGDAIALLQD